MPIIENTPFEQDLKDSLAACIQAYPETNAVLVRRHGVLVILEIKFKDFIRFYLVPYQVYVWGDNWRQAKTMTECYDYLFDVVISLKQLGIGSHLTPEQYELKYQANKAGRLSE